MRCYVQYIGVVDHCDCVHSVEFTPGVNVITGKSSTGKSAIIEIFDYCFGSSDFTVPDGVITSNAQLYFLVLRFPKISLVLARKGNEKRAYIKEEANATAIANPDLLQMAYFDDAYFIGLPEFKKELGRYFQVTMENTDEDLEARKYRHNNSKGATPSVRSFMSFMLQHQNLVANKHAIFYRFDEKERREQTIKHLKVFLGYADQRYFLDSQKLDALENDLRRIELQIPRQEDLRRQAIAKIDQSLREYASVTGSYMVETSGKIMIDNPERWLKEIGDLEMRIDGASEEFSKQSAKLEDQRSRLIAGLRTLERQRSAVRSSINFANEYIQEARAVIAPDKAVITVAECPFCHNYHSTMEDEAIRLQEAIQWLNEELRRSPYLRESFELDESKLSDDIANVRREIRTIEHQITVLSRQISALEKGRPISELAIKAKLCVEGILEGLLVESTSESLDGEKASLELQIERLKERQKDSGVERKLDEAQRYVELAMSDIGSRFGFEASYRPIALRFRFDSFDLWHETKDNRRVFLRAMGSGANWLYCHLSLFLALNKLFCSLGDGCKIPPILFLDQPSQVYFPTFGTDRSEKFDARELAEKAGREDSSDDDMRAVENLYSELARFCRQTLDETGVEPQIIVSDHADNLNLAEGATFESFVRARWRTRGFIHPLPDEQQ